MTFKMDTGWQRPDVQPVSAVADEGQYIAIRDHRRAQNLFNKIKDNIEVHELPEELDRYWQRETLTLDALFVFDPPVFDELREVYEMHRSCLAHGGAPRPADPGNQPAQEPDGQDGKDGDDNDLWF